MKYFFSFVLSLLFFFSQAVAQNDNLKVKISNGTLEGTYNPSTSIRSFKGITLAQPPVGDLRWKEPQPANSWTGARKADHFSHMPMQRHVFSDMLFRPDTMSA